MSERLFTSSKVRQRAGAFFATIALGTGISACSAEQPPVPEIGTCTPLAETSKEIKISTPEVSCYLGSLAVKGRAPKTGYTRDKFDDDWNRINGCDMRDIILMRDLTDVSVDEDCEVQSGLLHDPYTGKDVVFNRGIGTSGKVSIDHVVSLGDAWQKGAQQLDSLRREEFANDELNLQATSGPTNSSKGDRDYSGWKPPLKSERCRYIARQVIIKFEYNLWVTQAEHDDMQTTLKTCPDQTFSVPN